MNIAEFADLFKSYCDNYRYRETPESSPRPLYFMHFDAEDLVISIRSLRLPALFLSTPEDDFEGMGADSISESFEASFMVLLQLPNKDITQKGSILNKAKDIADNIIRRMLYDAKAGSTLEGLNVAGISAGQVSRTVDNLYGWTVSFNITTGFDGEIRPEVWEDLS